MDQEEVDASMVYDETKLDRNLNSVAGTVGGYREYQRRQEIFFGGSRLDARRDRRDCL